MPRDSIVSFDIQKHCSAGTSDATDLLAAEEPLEISLISGPNRLLKNISITMRTPGNDEELAAGFLFTEGIITSYSQVEQVFNNPEDCDNRQENKINIALKPDVAVDLVRLERNFYTSSSCGVCGKASINAIRTVCKASVENDDLKVTSARLYRLPELLRQKQNIFESTGGLHASALFNIAGDLTLLREDVGRHNALDKLIGAALKQEMIPLNEHILLLSGRASFELIQKAAMAGIRIIAAVGAPSSLAVQLAREFNITLIGFLRNERFNIYSASQRVVHES